MDQSFCPTNSTEKYAKSTSRRNFEAISQFYSQNRWTYKTRFFHFSFFLSKTNLKNVFKLLQIIAIYIMHYRDFSRKN